MEPDKKQPTPEWVTALQLIIGIGGALYAAYVLFLM